MRFFTDLRRGLLAASSLATLQVAVPAYAQQYPAYPQTAQPYAQAAAQNPYAALPQTSTAPPYAAVQPSATAAGVVATQPIAPTAPYQQFSAAQQQAAVATQQTTQQAAQQFNGGVQQVGQQSAQQYQAATQQAAGQYNAAVQYVAARPAATGVAAYGAYPTATPPVQQMPAQQAPQLSAFQQVYPNTVPPAVQTGAPQYGAQQQYPAQQPVYMARAMQTPSETGQNLPLTPPTEAVPPGAMMPTPAGAAPQPVPMNEHGYPPAAGGYESYPSGYGDPGAAAGNCAPYGMADYSSYGCEPSMSDKFFCRNTCNYWFGGVYGLLMARDSSDKYNLGLFDDSMPPNGYPSMPNIPVTTADVDPGFQGGVEFRLGRTFGGVVDPCGCGPCCPTWGIEGVYWEIFDNSQSFDYMPSMPSDYYSMMPMPGLEYNGGNGYLPVNTFWNYGPPVGAGTYDITDVRVRSNFEARNIEINLLRLNLCGCAPMCGPCGGCDAAGCNVGGPCGPGGCNTGYIAPNRYSISGVCGVRYLDLDDTFMYGVDYDGAVMGYLDYYSRAENKLLGFQLGSNAMYRIGCKWGLHANTLVGLYGNDIDTHQYFNSTTGMVRYVSSGDAFDAHASKTDVAMLGELRVGASYQATCRCRIYGGWRAMGLTGVALATNQAPNQWLTAGQGASYVNSSGSMILHGLQTGVEWNY
jgi:hypothetical protein